MQKKNTFSTGLSLDFFLGIVDESSGGSVGFLLRMYSLGCVRLVFDRRAEECFPDVKSWCGNSSAV